MIGCRRARTGSGSLGRLVIAAILAMPDQSLPGQAAPSAHGWVGLYNSARLEWLENENRLDELCVRFKDVPVQREQCRAERMQPKLATITVRDTPAAAGRVKGTILVTYAPGRGLSAQTSAGGKASAFVPDLFDADWGYGPYFHQTILDRQGSWYRIPIDALGGAGWVNSAEWTDDADVKPVDGIVSTPRGDLVVLGWTDRALRARPEQPADAWCQSGDPPALKPWQEIRIPLSELFNPGGHLLVTVKYKRGC